MTGFSGKTVGSDRAIFGCECLWLCLQQSKEDIIAVRGCLSARPSLHLTTHRPGAHLQASLYWIGNWSTESTRAGRGKPICPGYRDSPGSLRMGGEEQTTTLELCLPKCIEFCDFCHKVRTFLKSCCGDPKFIFWCRG